MEEICQISFRCYYFVVILIAVIVTNCSRENNSQAETVEYLIRKNYSMFTLINLKNLLSNASC